MPWSVPTPCLPALPFVLGAAWVLPVALPGQTGGSSAEAPSRKRTVKLYLPLPFGTRWAVLQGVNQDPTHNDKYNRYALDFRLPVGSPVHAAADGVVVATKEDATGPTGKVRDNNRVIIRHADGTATKYVHLQKDGALVEVGQQVLAGDLIGLSGNTGASSSPHLHFVVFSSYPGGISIPFRFEELGRRGVPKTGESPQSLNYPIRPLVADLLWLREAYAICVALDRRDAVAALLDEQLGSKSVPSSVRRQLRRAERSGRKDLDQVYARYRGLLAEVAERDFATALARLAKAQSAGRTAEAMGLALQARRDFAWHPEVRKVASLQASLTADKEAREQLRPVVAAFAEQRAARIALARAFSDAFKFNQLEGRRRRSAAKKLERSFAAVLADLPAGEARERLAGWVRRQLAPADQPR